jgi:hypothetical protein
MKTKTNNFRSTVFKWAHQIAQATGKGFAVCLAKAWQAYRLRKLLFNQTVKIAYEKTDGTLRTAIATLQVSADKIKGTGTPNFKTFTYWDIEAGGFRSFKIENLLFTL